MVNFMRESGSMGSGMVLELGKELKRIVMLESGEMEDPRDLEFFSGPMEIDTKGISKMA